MLQQEVATEEVAESGDAVAKDPVAAPKDDSLEGKPDSTTAKAPEVGSPTKEPTYKPTKRTFEVRMGQQIDKYIN